MLFELCKNSHHSKISHYTTCWAKYWPAECLVTFSYHHGRGAWHFQCHRGWPQLWVASEVELIKGEMKRTKEEAEGMQGSLVSFSPNSPFLFHDMFKTGQHLLVGERTEAEPGAARLEGRNDVGQVVTDKTKPHVVSELLDHCRQGGKEWKPCHKATLYPKQQHTHLFSKHSEHLESLHQPRPKWPAWNQNGI